MAGIVAAAVSHGPQMSNEAFVNQHVTLALDGQLACLEFGRAAATVFPPSGPSLESPVYEVQCTENTSAVLHSVNALFVAREVTLGRTRCGRALGVTPL